MKRRVLSLILALPLFAFAAEEVDVRIWKRIIFDLSLGEYRVYTADREVWDLLSRISGVKPVGSCTEATLIIDTKRHVVRDFRCERIPRLTNDYRTLVENPNEVGAFFWMKGRPTIVISGPRLRRFGLRVEAELEEFVEEIE